MATSNSNQVDQYFSALLDNGALGIDAFTKDWDQFTLAYIFPPPPMVELILNRIYQCSKNTSFIVITPWRPSVQWFPKALKLAVQPPVRLPVSWDTVVDLTVLTQYCQRNQLDEAAPSSVNLINFLQYKFEVNKKQYRTINTYRSAVSTTLGTCRSLGVPVGQDPLVCRCMRGIHRLRPPKTKLFPTWDIVTVLNSVLKWGETKKLPLKKLLTKTAFLVVLVCYKRPADMCNMQVVEGFW